MTFMYWLLYGTATWLLLAGIWDHDWRLILASVSVAIIYPLITADIEDDEAQPAACLGCTRHHVISGCPIHDDQMRKAA